MAVALAPPLLFLAALQPALGRQLLDAARVATPPAAPPTPCFARPGYGRRPDVIPGGATAAPSPCFAAPSDTHGISVFTLIWVAAGGLCLVLLVRIVRLRLLAPPEAAAAASGAGGAAGQNGESSWKVRYGVRVEQPDGGIVAGLEASIRAGLAHTASVVRRTAESLRGVGRNTPGNSIHAAWDALGVVSEAGPSAEAAAPANGAALPPADWEGWRLPARAAQTPPALAALHAALAAQEVPSAPAWPAQAEPGASPEEGTTHRGLPPS